MNYTHYAASNAKLQVEYGNELLRIWTDIGAEHKLRQPPGIYIEGQEINVPRGISGSHGVHYEVYCLLGCDPV
jgi:hypothetical protein